MNSREHLYEQEIDTCLVCKKQPIPESKPQLLVVAAGVLLMLWSVRLAVGVLLASYYFSVITWKCPLCKREIEVRTNDPELAENLLLRCGNCLVMLSKRKFLIGASVIMVVLFFTRSSSMHSVKPLLEGEELRATASWQSLVSHTGKAAILDNEHHARNQFEKYTDLGYWRLKGYYMRTDERLPTDQHVLQLKMSPTQNRDPSKPDMTVLTGEPIPQGLKPGDELEFEGEVVESATDNYVFHATEVIKTGEHRDLSTVPEFEFVKHLNFGHLRNEQVESGKTLVAAAADSQKPVKPSQP